MIGLLCLFVAVIHQASCQAVGSLSRGEEEARKCYEEMMSNGDISHLLLDVTSPENIDFFCGRISRLKKCIADNEHHLSNAENTEYLQKIRGISSFYLNVCPPGTDITAKYKGNAPCFQLIKNQILSCGSDLPDMTSYKMKNDLDSRCCALSTHRHCVLQASAQNCGKEAAEVVDQILMRYFRHEMEGCKDRGCSDEVTTDNPPGHHNEERRKSEDRSNRSNRKGVGAEPTEEDYDTYSENWKHYTTPKYHSMDSAGPQMSLISSVAMVLLQIILLK